MALTDSFPGPNGLTDSIEAGKDLAGLFAQDAQGVTRAGILPGHVNSVLTRRVDMQLDVSPFTAVLVRDGAVRLISNDADTQTPEFTIPSANSRIDVLYVKVGEVDLGDPVDGPFFGIVEGAAAASPTRPTLNIPGALELATVLIPSTATRTTQTTVNWTAQFTAAAGGVVTMYNTAQMNAWAPSNGQRIFNREDGRSYERRSSQWVMDAIYSAGQVTPALGSGWSSPNVLNLKRDGGWAQINFNVARGGTALGTGGVAVSIPAGYRTDGNVWGFAWGLGGATNPLPVYYDAATHQVKINTALGAGQSIAFSLAWRVES